ncbi:MAG TPA: glycosyltransferase [Solirubrobacteraceae bacterium]
MSSALRGDRQPASAGHRLRPHVDVVVPFAGSATALDEVCARFAVLELRPDDSLLVVDNTPGRGEQNGSRSSDIDVMRASGLQTPGFARNFGATQGRAEWLVFLDADTVPAPDLLDRYFEPPPEPSTALIGGGVFDEEVPPDAPPAARYAYLRRLMSQEHTLDLGRWGFPKSVNVACRRAAFEAVGGFNVGIRAGEDADFTYRLKRAGWEVERREAAAVIHLSRRTLRGLIEQQALWGTGAGWLGRAYPGSMPLIRDADSLWQVLGEPLKAVLRTRLRDRDAAIYAALRPTEAFARRIGRLLPNEQSTRSGGRRSSRRPSV